MDDAKCAHCGHPAVYAEPHEIWCVNCGGYFAGDLYANLSIQDKSDRPAQSRKLT